MFTIFRLPLERIIIGMDRSWMYLRERTSNYYRSKVDDFLKFAYQNKVEQSAIYCPCKECDNRYFLSKEAIKGHLIIYGFTDNYFVWTSHGETHASEQTMHNSNCATHSNMGDDMVGMVHDAFGFSNENYNLGRGNPSEDEQFHGPNEDTKHFLKLLQDAECELYPGCEHFTKLSFIVHLLHLKVLGGWSDTSFTELLELLKKAFPYAQLPKSCMRIVINVRYVKHQGTNQRVKN